MSATASPNEPKSVSQILKQRQQSRSAAVAPKAGGSKGPPGPGGTVNENLNPVLPPLYPTAPKSIPLIAEVAHTVKVYNKLAQYFRSNFSVVQESKGVTDGFYLDRYTDQYKSPLSLKPHLLHNLPDSKYPEELTKKTAVAHKPSLSRRKRRRIEDISDEEAEGKEAAPKKPAENTPEEDEEEEKEDTTIDDLDELEEELDEEMDVGTDYAQSYFDNGEGDEDDRDEDDGPTY